MPSTHLENKVNTLSYHWSDVLHNEHAAVFTIAKSTEADILNDVKSSLIDALRNGKTLQQFKKELTPILQEKGWWGKKEALNPKTGEQELVQLGSPRRLQTIYEANKRSSRAAALWDRAQATKEVLPYFLYKLGPSKHHRDLHKSWEGIILPIDHPFWDYAFPPNGWGCRCYVVQISEEECQRRGGVSKAPIIKFDSKSAGGRNIKYMRGVDPAWSSNSGKFRNKTLSDILEQKLLKSSPVMAETQITNIVKSSFFTSFFNNAKKVQDEIKPLKNRQYNYVPVAYVQRGISSKPKVLKVSEETLAVKKEAHADLLVSDYALIQDIISTGHYNESKKAYIKQIGKYYYLVATKITAEGGLLMNSFYKIREEQFKEWIKK